MAATSLDEGEMIGGFAGKINARVR